MHQNPPMWGRMAAESAREAAAALQVAVEADEAGDEAKAERYYRIADEAMAEAKEYGDKARALAARA